MDDFLKFIGLILVVIVIPKLILMSVRDDVAMIILSSIVILSLVWIYFSFLYGGLILGFIAILCALFYLYLIIV